MATPAAYESSWARDWIWAAASMPDPLTHCTGPGREPMSPQPFGLLQSNSYPTVPQQELPTHLLLRWHVVRLLNESLTMLLNECSYDLTSTMSLTSTFTSLLTSHSVLLTLAPWFCFQMCISPLQGLGLHFSASNALPLYICMAHINLFQVSDQTSPF